MESEQFSADIFDVSANFDFLSGETSEDYPARAEVADYDHYQPWNDTDFWSWQANGTFNSGGESSRTLTAKSSVPVACELSGPVNHVETDSSPCNVAESWTFSSAQHPVDPAANAFALGGEQTNFYGRAIAQGTQDEESLDASALQNKSCDASPMDSSKRQATTKLAPKRRATGMSSSMSVQKPYRDIKRRMNRAGVKTARRDRKSSTCIRCSMYHESWCSDTIPCERCKDLNDSAFFVQPCSKDDLDLIVTFRAGNSRAGLRRSTLPELRWTNSNTASYLLKLRYPITHVQAHDVPILDVRCRQFDPRPEDILEDAYEMPDGSFRILLHPAYACYDTQETLEAIKDYMYQCRPLLDRQMSLVAGGVSDEMCKLTVTEADRYATKSPESIVATALKLKSFVTFCEDALHITNPGVIPYPTEYHPTKVFDRSDALPVPSVLDFQLDTLAITHMTELLDQIVRRMRKIFYSARRKKRYWYEVYLCTFVLLHTLEHVHRHQMKILRESKVMSDGFRHRVDFYTQSMIDEWEHSANNLVYHFRYILRGTIPFEDLSDERLRVLETEEDLDGLAIAYLRQANEVVRAEKSRSAGILGDSESMSSSLRTTWSSQLWLPKEPRGF